MFMDVLSTKRYLVFRDTSQETIRGEFYDPCQSHRYGQGETADLEQRR
jgi:hypothetical protein